MLGIYIILCGEGLRAGRINSYFALPSRGCENGRICRFSPRGNRAKDCVSGLLLRHTTKKLSGDMGRYYIESVENSRLRTCCQDKRFAPEISFFSFLFPPDFLPPVPT